MDKNLELYRIAYSALADRPAPIEIRDLQSALGIRGMSTAYALLNDWHKRGLVRIDSSGKNKKWYFKEEQL